MRRILLTWELGGNLGHLTRLLPLAVELKARGHRVLVAARELGPAAEVLGACGIPFVQSPQPTVLSSQTDLQVSYADILWHTGWSHFPQLSGMVQAWINLYSLFGADLVVLDHSPTALLAAHAVALPRVLQGAGFEIPPSCAPLPPFPNVDRATPAAAAAAEARVLLHANRMLEALGVPGLGALRELLSGVPQWLTTFPELDPYGIRTDAAYLGPIGELAGGLCPAWPGSSGRRVFAYLRPEMPAIPAILGALEQAGASVICYAPAVDQQLLGNLVKNGAVISTQPLDLQRLLPQASAVVSYGSSHIVSKSLLAGKPLLLAPMYLESYLTAQRVVALGAGLMLDHRSTQVDAAAALQQLLSLKHHGAAAQAFAARHPAHDTREAIVRMADALDGLWRER